MSSQPASPTCFGYCETCKATHNLPVGNSRAAAKNLMNELDTLKRIDDGSNPKFSTHTLWGPARGQMFGVLECTDTNNNPVILKAFSCQYNGEWLADGWAPPLFDVDAFHQLTMPVYKQIHDLGLQIAAHPKQADLIEQRASLSRNLMQEIHQLYSLTNFKGELRSLSEILGKRKGIPAGTGDCCAPKLLNQAALRGLTPVGLSEFYWGKESKSGARRHKELYPSCAEKCQPILGFMLCGSQMECAGLPAPFSPKMASPNPAQALISIEGGASSAIPKRRQAAALHIVFQDDLFVVINKPSGLLSVPGKGPENQDCVSARIKALLPDAPDHPEVHRLDMDTSGLMVLARTKEAHRELSRQFHDRETGKRYIALLDGVLSEKSGTIELPFRLDVDNRPKQIYDPIHGKIGLTHWKTLSVSNGQTRVEFTPITGRTHQLRIHAASDHGLDTPIVGDRLYGTGTAPGQLKLHAAALSFTHPHTGEKLTFTSDPLF